jgi:hypothetical protein
MVELRIQMDIKPTKDELPNRDNGEADDGTAWIAGVRADQQEESHILHSSRL